MHIRNIPLYLAILVAAYGNISACGNRGVDKVEYAVILKYELFSDSIYTVGRPVKIGFNLHNLTGDTLCVLTWYTPLEGMKGKIFNIKHLGKKLIYQGRMVKRGNPAAEDYVCIPPHGKIGTLTDLSGAYDFSSPGEYSLDFVGIIHDVSRERANIPRSMDSHKGMRALGDSIILHICAE